MSVAGHLFDEKTDSSEHDTKHKKDVATSSLSDSVLLFPDADRQSIRCAWRCGSVNTQSYSHAATLVRDT
jgi:hypothetical protein